VPLTAEAVEASDCVVIVTDHSQLDYALIRDRARAIVDTRNVIRKA
jgi:UDP-N-acetyl-D-glucosamine dehydrogenase